MQGFALVASSNEHGRDACLAKCTACGIPSFNVASTVNQLQCTGCLPGFVLSGGQCIESCPTGTFLNPKDNVTCTGAFLLLAKRLEADQCLQLATRRAAAALVHRHSA